MVMQKLYINWDTVTLNKYLWNEQMVSLLSQTHLHSANRGITFLSDPKVL